MLKIIKTKINFWSFITYFISFLLFLPIIIILLVGLDKNTETTEYIFKYFLKEYIFNTTIISIISTILAVVISFITACIMIFYNFKFRKIYKFLLILPFAIPSYILAYVYTDIFSYSGIIITKLRQTYGINIYMDIMNIYGIIFIFTVSFYPYIYIILHSHLKRQNQNILDNAKLLGLNELQIIWRVIIPLSVPAILSGSLLMLMEVLNGFGVPYYFGVNVFSSGIYNAWISYQDISSAIKLSFILLIICYVIIFITHIIKQHRKYEYVNTKIKYIRPQQAHILKEILIHIFLLMLVSIGVFIPIIKLLIWFYQSLSAIRSYEYMVIPQTLLITIISTFLIILLSIILANHSRKNKKYFIKLSTMGYSIPGVIISIGILMTFLNIDKKLGYAKLYFTFSLIPLIFAFITRFIMISYNAVDSGFNKIGNRFNEASQVLGYSPFKSLIYIDIPLIKNSIISASILVFIEIIKELPMTSMLLPFNYETLSMNISRYAGQEILPKTSISALVIIVISIILLYVFTRLEKE